ncbi:MAG: hypothetical protein FWE29_04085 [Defluviitaleaceae bacterium]|nr:hypothetical protein [Defluviitaleaceae bacterium]
MNVVWKKLLILSPIVILIAMLYFVNHTIILLRDITYSFVFSNNAGAVQMFEKELKALPLPGYPKAEYSKFYSGIIHAFSNVLGEKHVVITFLIDENGTVHHSNYENEKMLEAWLENECELRRQIKANKSGYVILHNLEEEMLFYYTTIFDGTQNYRLFVGIDRDALEAEINFDKIIIPVSIIGFLLIVFVQYSIWLRMTYGKRQVK